MPHTIFYNAEDHVVESKFTEDLTVDEVKKFIAEGVQISRETGCILFLTDYREVRLKLSVLEIYQIPQLMKAAFASLASNAHQIRRAIVVENDLENYQFYENVTVNNGQQAKLFRNMDEAREWLLKP